VNQDWIHQYAWLLALLALWELVWKGLALWKAARNNDKAWFVTILIINAAGLLSIAYLFVFSKRPKAQLPTPKA
jgi:hypothetical protein